jgi:hypothetical protein
MFVCPAVSWFPFFFITLCSHCCVESFTDFSPRLLRFLVVGLALALAHAEPNLVDLGSPDLRARQMFNLFDDTDRYGTTLI